VERPARAEKSTKKLQQFGCVVVKEVNMSAQERLDAALVIISEHNTAVGGEKNAGYVNPGQFISCIKASGGTSEDRLKRFSYEDILQCLPAIFVQRVGGDETHVKPVALAKDLAKAFRGKDDVSSEKRPIGSKKAEKMTPRELVESYDPDEPENSVGKRLKDISRGEPFIVFADNNNVVDVESTFKLLMEVKGGYPGRKDIDVGGVIKPVYRVGDKADAYADENPLYPGRPLRPDGTCDQTGRSWEGVTLELRQLVRIAMETGELDVTIETAHNILDMVVGSEPMMKLRKRYREASVKFDELKRVGNLPKLTVPLVKGASAPRRPFDSGKRVEWSVNAMAGHAYINKAGKWQRW
jgi:hypothetical protein